MSRVEAKGWDEIWSRWSGVWEGRAPEPAVLDLAARLKAEGRRRVHDLGCGPGRHLLFLAAEGFEASGSDFSPAAVETCRRRLQEAGLSAPVTLAEMTELPAEDGSLDAVIAWDVVYHGTLDTIRRTVAGVRRKLSPGGYFLLAFNSVESASYLRAREELARGEAEESEPNTFVVPGDPFDKALPHHYTTEQEIRDEIMDGFHILSLTEVPSRATAHGAAPRRGVKFHVLGVSEDSGG
jgi:SAM-dependent methyltransferase